jgi:hypothetical protein
MKGDLQSSSLEGLRVLKLVPLVIRYAAGVPSIVSNPLNESATVTDTGTGDVLITLAEASLAPIHVAGLAVLASAPATLGNIVHLKSAPTTTAVALLVQDASDGATEVDPVDIHVTLIKMIAG